LQNKKYRTPKFKEGFGYIYDNISKLENSSIKKGDSLSKVSRVVDYTFELSNLDLLKDLAKVVDSGKSKTTFLHPVFNLVVLGSDDRNYE